MLLDEQKLCDLIKRCIREVLDERQMVVDADIMTKDEIAKLLGVCTRSITTYMKREGMPHTYRNGHPVFKRAEVLPWWRERGKPVPTLMAI